jgi:Superinfection exclusion gene product 17
MKINDRRTPVRAVKFSAEVGEERSRGATQGALRVWHIPQVPGQPFYVHVDSVNTAIQVLNLLAAYDLFQYQNKVKPDYTNAQGLEVYEGGEWGEWHNDDDEDIGDVMRRES